MCSKFNILNVNNGETIWDSRLLSVKKMLIFGGEKFNYSFGVQLYFVYFFKDQSLMFPENYETPLRKRPHSEKTRFVSPLINK